MPARTRISVLIALLASSQLGCDREPAPSSPVRGTWSLIAIDDKPLPEGTTATIDCASDGSAKMTTAGDPKPFAGITAEEIDKRFRSVKQPDKTPGVTLTISYQPGTTLTILRENGHRLTVKKLAD